MELQVFWVQNHDLPFKDSLLGTLNLISFSCRKKQLQTYWGQNLSYFGIKQQRLIILHYALFSFFKDPWGPGVHLLSFKATAVWEQCMIWVSAHPKQDAEDTSLVQQHWARDRESLCVTRVSLAVTTQCCVMQPFMVTAAASHPSPAPSIRNRLCGSSQGCSVLWNAAGTIAMAETICPSVLVKLIVSFSPKWPWKIASTALTSFLHELPSIWEELRILLHQKNPENDSQKCL